MKNNRVEASGGSLRSENGQILTRPSLTNDKVMKKIEIKNENIVMNLLKKGFKVEGRLWLEETEDGEFIIWFQQYDRKPKQQRNWLIRRLEHGWVKESVERTRCMRASPSRLARLAFWR